jgi:hypothetical protein
MSLKYKKKEKKLNEIKYSNRKPDPCVLSLSLSPSFSVVFLFVLGKNRSNLI